MATADQTLAQILARSTREGRALRAARQRARALLRLRPPLPDPARPRRHLPRALQRGRDAQGAVRLRGRAAARPGREEAVLPRAAGRAGALLRHARLRLSTAVTARTGSPRRRCAIQAATAPSEDDDAGRARAPGARSAGRAIVTSTYNEPLITSEWAVEVFREAKAAGLVCSYVSNGNGTPEVLDYIRPWVSLYKVDLKSFRDRPLPRARRHARARALDDPRAPRAGLLAGDRDAGHAGLQRLGRGAHGTSRASWSRSRPTSPGT